MDTSVVFFIIVALGGVVCILSSYYEWIWWWRLSGLGNIFYNRFGHETTRLAYALIGTLLIASVARELVVSVLATTWGKILFIALVLLVAGFVYYVRRNGGAKFKREKKEKGVGEIGGNNGSDVFHK